MTNFYKSTAVTPQFRNTILQQFPIMAHAKGIRYLRLLDYLLFGTFADEHTKRLMLGHDLLKHLRYGEVNKSRNFNAKLFLDQFSTLVFQINTTQHDWQGNKVRTLSNASIPVWLESALETLRSSSPSERSVRLVSGASIDPITDRKIRLSEVESSYPLAKDKMVLDVLKYLNGLDACHFECVRDRCADAFQVAMNMPEGNARDIQIRLLDRIMLEPMPVYRAVEQSSRIYSSGPSLLNLTSSVRTELTKDWVKIDLKQAQLNIVSSIWNEPNIRTFLCGCSSGLWRNIADHVGLPLTVETKGAIKTAIYSLLYMAGRSRITADLSKSLNPTAAESFFTHMLVAALFTMRDAQSRRLRRNGFLLDAFGNKMEIDIRLGKKDGDAQIRSILACQAQSYELPILYPVVQYAISTQTTTSPLILTGWLHDGIWVHCEDKKALPGHVQEIERLIKVESEKLLGFSLQAEVEMPSLPLVSVAA